MTGHFYGPSSCFFRCKGVYYAHVYHRFSNRGKPLKKSAAEKNLFLRRQFQNSSKPSKSPRFDLQQGAFSAVTIQVATSNYPLQIFANVFFVIFGKTFEITSKTIIFLLSCILLVTAAVSSSSEQTYTALHIPEEYFPANGCFSQISDAGLTDGPNSPYAVQSLRNTLSKRPALRRQYRSCTSLSPEILFLSGEFSECVKSADIPFSQISSHIFFKHKYTSLVRDGPAADVDFIS